MAFLRNPNSIHRFFTASSKYKATLTRRALSNFHNDDGGVEWSRFITVSAGSVVTSERIMLKTQALVSIISSKQASETLLDECGHPRLAPLHLKVSTISGCDGFVPAAQA